MDSHTPGLELALLEGMSETLLLKLREAGIATRRDLEQAVQTPADRVQLAARLSVPPLQLEALHYLNFVLPEERAARQLQHESHVRTTFGRLRAAQRQTRVWAAAAVILALGAVAVVFFTRGEPRAPAGFTVEAGRALEDSLALLQSEMQNLKPLVRNQSRLRLASVAQELIPAPGWNGALLWRREDHRRLDWASEANPADRRVKAVSLAFRTLAEVEDPLNWNRPVLDKAREAAVLVQEFPPITSPRDGWDLAAAAVRLRLVTRAGGLANLAHQDIGVLTVSAGFWNGYAFAPCEALLAGLEGLPAGAEARPLWGDTLMELRRQANTGRDRWGEAPQAWAREYWVVRAETEAAVMAAIAGWPNLEPYASGSPAALIDARVPYLERALTMCPPSARVPLAWLRVELEEARNLVAWLQADPSRAAPAQNHPWVEAVCSLDTARAAASESVALPALVQRALDAEHFDSSDPFTHPRTRWECGLKPLLMETRRRALARVESSPPASP